MTPYVSIVIPAFNAQETLSETLDSVAAQSADVASEILVVDDGSLDATAEMAESHPSAPRVLRLPNRGAASALNSGIGEARGEVFCFLDADDLWTADKLGLQLAALEENSALDFVLGHTETFECPSVDPVDFNGLSYVKGIAAGYLTSTLMVRRDAIENRFGLFDTALRTGYFIDWYRRATGMGARYRILEPVLHRRRIRPNTLSRRQTVANRPDEGLSKDFLEIARRALQQKRQAS